MKSYRKNLGEWGERVAAQYLEQHGYHILEFNVFTPFGELDLVAQQTVGAPDKGAAINAIVFFEVKTRTSTAYGLPEEAVTSRKQQHLLSAAQDYLQKHPELSGDWRIDVIAVQREPGKMPTITHFENAVT